MIYPDPKMLPTPSVMAKRQREAFADAVDLTVTQWSDALNNQRSSDTYIGTIWLFQRELNEVQMAAVQRFRENGWSVLIRSSLSRFPLPIKRIVFAPWVSYDVNVPMPEGVAAPKSEVRQCRCSASNICDYPSSLPKTDFVPAPSPTEVLAAQQHKFDATVQETINSWLKQLEGQTFKDYSWGFIDELGYPLSAIEEEAVKRFEKAGWAIQRQRRFATRGIAKLCTRLTFASKPPPPEPGPPTR